MEDCISTKSSNAQVEFYHQEYELKLPMWITYLKAEENDFILIYTDTLLLISGISLPLNPATDYTAYDFEYITYSLDTVPESNPLKVNRNAIDTISSTIEFEYTRRQRIISPECGVEQSFYNLRILSHNFDSVLVVNDTIDRFKPVNVNIYF